jgi:hypothetical protein
MAWEYASVFFLFNARGYFWWSKVLFHIGGNWATKMPMTIVAQSQKKLTLIYYCTNQG